MTYLEKNYTLEKKIAEIHLSLLLIEDFDNQIVQNDLHIYYT